MDDRGEIVYPLSSREEAAIRWFRRFAMTAFLTSLLFLLPGFFTGLLDLLGQILGAFAGGV